MKCEYHFAAGGYSAPTLEDYATEIKTVCAELNKTIEAATKAGLRVVVIVDDRSCVSEPDRPIIEVTISKVF